MTQMMLKCAQDILFLGEMCKRWKNWLSENINVQVPENSAQMVEMPGKTDKAYYILPQGAKYLNYHRSLVSEKIRLVIKKRGTLT